MTVQQAIITLVGAFVSVMLVTIITYAQIYIELIYKNTIRKEEWNGKCYFSDQYEGRSW